MSALDNLAQTLPKCHEELMQSSRNIEQIAVYCKNAYITENDKVAIYNQTQAYIKDALANVAYHVHTVGLHLTSYLEEQTNEIDRLDLNLRMLNDRLKANKEAVGISAFRAGDAQRNYHQKSKLRKLDESEINDPSKNLQKIGRIPLNLKALDNVGIDLSGNRGTDQFGVHSPPPSLSINQNQSSSNYPSQSQSQSQYQQPQQQAPRPQPTKGSGPPPVPNNTRPVHQPPSQSLPPRPNQNQPPQSYQPPPPPSNLNQPTFYPPPPPSFGGDENYMIPPPPPPELEDFDMETPPPPPFSNQDLPPPPPPDF
jgi:hypothetical protein